MSIFSVYSLSTETFNFRIISIGPETAETAVISSWVVTSVVEHFNKMGTAVYGAAMDMSKAFNLVEWSELLLTLVQRQVNPIFLRLMFFIYTNQKCDVKWCQDFLLVMVYTRGLLVQQFCLLFSLTSKSL